MSRNVPNWLISNPIAHRGLHGHGVPENSLGAFRAASANGYPLELDVRLSLDGEVIVFHDRTLHRMTGRPGDVSGSDAAALARLPLGETNECIPLLRDVLAADTITTPLLIEVKNAGAAGALEAATWDLLRDYHGEFAVQSFNPETLKWFKAHAPDVVRGHLAGDFRDENVDEDTRERLRAMESLPDTAPAFIGYDVRCLPYEPVERAGLAGIRILGWTVRSRKDEARARLYCDNIIFEGFAPGGS